MFVRRFLTCSRYCLNRPRLLGVTFATLGIIGYYHYRYSPAMKQGHVTKRQAPTTPWPWRIEPANGKLKAADYDFAPKKHRDDWGFLPLETDELDGSFSKLRRESKDKDGLKWALTSGRMSVSCAQGYRPSMEDRFAFAARDRIRVYALFDGHGGEATVDAAESELTGRIADKLSKKPDLLKSHDSLAQFLENEISNFDKEFGIRLKAKEDSNNPDTSGSTALIAVLHGSQLTVANVGDSRGVLCDSGGHAVPVSVDHKPDDPKEHERIKAVGGFIAMYGVWRVQGVLATSRALGDFFLKPDGMATPFVIPTPDVVTQDASDASFLILASDGLWDVMSNQDAVDYVKSNLEEPGYALDELVKTAIKQGSLDNVTVMVIKF